MSESRYMNNMFDNLCSILGMYGRGEKEEATHAEIKVGDKVAVVIDSECKGEWNIEEALENVEAKEIGITHEDVEGEVISVNGKDI